MKKGIIVLSIIFASVGGCIYWRSRPHVYHIPGATITVVDEDTGEPIPNVLTDIYWGGHNFEGVFIKRNWKFTDANGVVEVDPLTVRFFVSKFDGVSADLIHPLYLPGGWSLNADIDRKKHWSLTIPNPPRKTIVVKLKSYEKTLDIINGCEEEKKYKNGLHRHDHRSLVGNYSRYRHALFRSHLNDALDDGLIRDKIGNVLNRVLRECPDKAKDFIEMLNRK